MIKIKLSFLGVVLSFGSSLFASGLVIHTAEFGVGKFHRYDNKVHAYGAENAWAPYILENAAPTHAPLIRDNADGSVTIFFSTLDELLQSVVQVSQNKNQKVSVLNLHGHGLPGAMWFPATAADLKSWHCADWVGAASGSDSGNYNQYYSAVSPSQIRQIRAMGNNPNLKMGCTTGLNEWTAGVKKLPEFMTVLAPDVQIHFLSCVVGLGIVGQKFTQGIAQLLLPKESSGRVETSLNFGLGDWSMTQGMGFWDMQSEAQVNHDNQIYGKNKRDQDIAQRGTVRSVAYGAAGWTSQLLADRDYLSLSFETKTVGTFVLEPTPEPTDPLDIPMRVQVPGTNRFVWILDK